MTKYNMQKFRHLQSFDSVREMDHHVSQHNKKLSKTHYETLNILKMYSCVVPGVSHIKMQTIADKLGKSRRTIVRHINYLYQNGFITIVNNIREKSGGTGASVYVINSVQYRDEFVQMQENDTAKASQRHNDDEQAESVDTTASDKSAFKRQTVIFLSYINSLKSTVNRKINKSVETEENTFKNKRVNPPNVDRDIYIEFSAFFSDDEISKLYGSLSKDFEKYSTQYQKADKIEYISRTFRALVKAIKDYHIGKRAVNVYNHVQYCHQTLINYLVKDLINKDIDEYVSYI